MSNGVGDGGMTRVAQELADNIMDKEPTISVSSRTFTKEFHDEKCSPGHKEEILVAAVPLLQQKSTGSQHCSPLSQQDSCEDSTSSYMLADDHSVLSREIDHWMNGNNPVMLPMENAAVQGSRIPVVVQRSVLARSTSSLENSRLWYVLAMVLPLFSVTSCPHPQWRCTPSLVFHTLELCVAHLIRMFGNIRNHIRRLAHDQVARELFATAMDVVLVVYAIGFLILSMYQASIFG